MRSGRTGAWRSTPARVSSRDGPRRRTFPGAAEGKVRLQLFTTLPISGSSYTAKEFQSSAQNALEMKQSRPKSILGRQITNNPSCPTVRVGAFGHFYKKMTGVKYGGIRQLHDLFENLLSKRFRRAKISQTSGVGGFKRTRKGVFT